MGTKVTLFRNLFAVQLFFYKADRIKKNLKSQSTDYKMRFSVHLYSKPKQTLLTISQL